MGQHLNLMQIQLWMQIMGQHKHTCLNLGLQAILAHNLGQQAICVHLKLLAHNHLKLGLQANIMHASGPKLDLKLNQHQTKLNQHQTQFRAKQASLSRLGQMSLHQIIQIQIRAKHHQNTKQTQIKTNKQIMHQHLIQMHFSQFRAASMHKYSLPTHFRANTHQYL